MKASEFLCPEPVWTDTDNDNDDDDEPVGGGVRSTSRACTLQRPRLHSQTPRRVSKPRTTALHNEVIPAAEQGISSGARAVVVPDDRTNGTRTDGYVFEKARGRGFPW